MATIEFKSNLNTIFELSYADPTPNEIKKAPSDYKTFHSKVSDSKRIADMFPLNIKIMGASIKRMQYSFGFDDFDKTYRMLQQAKTVQDSINTDEFNSMNPIRLIVLDTSFSRGLLQNIDQNKSLYNFICYITKTKIEANFLDTLNETISLLPPKRKIKGMLYTNIRFFNKFKDKMEELKKVVYELKPDFFLKEGSLKIDMTKSLKNDYLSLDSVDRCYLCELVMNGFKMGKNVTVKCNNRKLTFHPYNYFSKGLEVSKQRPVFAENNINNHFEMRTYYSSEYRDIYTEFSRYSRALDQYLIKIEKFPNGDSIFNLHFNVSVFHNREVRNSIICFPRETAKSTLSTIPSEKKCSYSLRLAKNLYRKITILQNTITCLYYQDLKVLKIILSAEIQKRKDNFQLIFMLFEKGTLSTQQQTENSSWVIKTHKTMDGLHSFIWILKTTECPEGPHTNDSLIFLTTSVESPKRFRLLKSYLSIQ